MADMTTLEIRDRAPVVVHSNGDITILDARSKKGTRRLRVGSRRWIREARHLIRNGLMPTEIENDDGSVTML